MQKSLPQNQRSQEQAYDKDMLLPYQWATPPSFVWQQTIQGRKDQKTSSANTNFSVQSYGDILKFGSRFIFSGTTGTGNTQSKITTAQGHFQRQDPSKSLLGFLKAGRIAFGDVTFPDVPLIVGRRRGRGVIVSSESNLRLSRSFGAETYNVDGGSTFGMGCRIIPKRIFCRLSGSW